MLEKDEKMFCAPALPLGPGVLAIQQGHALPGIDSKGTERHKSPEKETFILDNLRPLIKFDVTYILSRSEQYWTIVII